MKDYFKRYYENNKEKIKENVKKWKLNNPEKVRKYRKEELLKNPKMVRNRQNRYRLSHLDEDKKRKKEYALKYPERLKNSCIKYKLNHPNQHPNQHQNHHKEWIESNRKYVRNWKRSYESKRRKEDVSYKLKHNLNNRLLRCFTSFSTTGKLTSSKYYGINWKNILQKLILTLPEDYNERKYHIDHIIPCSIFNFNNRKEVNFCFSSGNIQWLTAEENLKKFNKIL
jgi:signal recognition particle GTPase